MKKDEYIERHGEEAYEKKIGYNRQWRKGHSERIEITGKEWEKRNKEKRVGYTQKWQVQNQEKTKLYHDEQNRVGGRTYQHKQNYMRSGIQHGRNKLRTKHCILYMHYKAIVAPGSQIHHEWIPGTAKYRGMALVEADRHMHGFIEVIEILEGKITLSTEKEIKGEKKYGI